MYSERKKNYISRNTANYNILTIQRVSVLQEESDDIQKYENLPVDRTGRFKIQNATFGQNTIPTQIR